MSPSTTVPVTLKHRFLKNFTVWVFFLLPSKIARVFVKLSLISMIAESRNKDLASNEETFLKIGHILNVNLSKEVMLLPMRTYKWYWGDDILEIPLSDQAGALSVRQAIQDNKTLMENRNKVFDFLLDSLPTVMRIKLGLYETRNRLAINHDLCKILNHAV